MILDGKAIARDLRLGLRDRVEALRARGVQLGFAAILVGQHAPSILYVRNKKKAFEELGAHVIIQEFPEQVRFEDVAALIKRWNDDPAIHGILPQLPLPAHLSAQAVIALIAPEKDVDGLGLINVGKRTLGLPAILPCTPKGCMKLIKSVQSDMSGLNALVIGRSDLVGKPMAQLLLRENCTVTQAHSHTQNLSDLCRQADIVVAAIGSPQAVKGDWIKQGAIIMDVGINRIDDQLVGDVEFAVASKRAGAITPVPGGVGPMTIACLLENTVEAAEATI
jgi:methylenetetrahydrofolate dehydrogenase (NADP+)/methenyltetrahydrofolate cyclohydrolase